VHFETKTSPEKWIARAGVIALGVSAVAAFLHSCNGEQLIARLELLTAHASTRISKPNSKDRMPKPLSSSSDRMPSPLISKIPMLLKKL
jgi:hypothetical protein